MTADVRHDVTSHGSVSERIYLGLRQEIMHCAIAPGATLDAASIARRYEVSKTPVRDAMQKLAADGLVTILPRSGYRVAAITFQAVHVVQGQADGEPGQQEAEAPPRGRAARGDVGCMSHALVSGAQ